MVSFTLIVGHHSVFFAIGHGQWPTIWQIAIAIWAHPALNTCIKFNQGNGGKRNYPKEGAKALECHAIVGIPGNLAS
jgi:hypothetical protein